MNIEKFFDLNGGYFIERAFVRAAIKSILDESLNQFYILRHLNIRNADTFDTAVVHYDTIEARYTGQEVHANTRIPARGINQDKLAGDITIFFNIFKETSKEIEKHGTYHIIKDAICNIRRMDKDEHEVLELKKRNENEIKFINVQQDEERQLSFNKIEETNEKIQQIVFDIDNVIVYGRYRTNFFKSFESARREQNQYINWSKENKYKKVTIEIEEKMVLENICHEKFVEYIDEERNDLLELINFWIKKYETEIELRDNEMLKLNADFEFITELLESRTKEYIKRKTEMEKWIEYKQMKMDKEQHENRQASAITHIQSWWRGTMWRKGISPGNIRASKKGKKGKK